MERADFVPPAQGFEGIEAERPAQVDKRGRARDSIQASGERVRICPDGVIRYDHEDDRSGLTVKAPREASHAPACRDENRSVP
jgi:hypothetical protein